MGYANDTPNNNTECRCLTARNKVNDADLIGASVYKARLIAERAGSNALLVLVGAADADAVAGLQGDEPPAWFQGAMKDLLKPITDKLELHTALLQKADRRSALVCGT